jgi:hypothetical protein
MFYEFAQNSKVKYLPIVTGVYRRSLGSASRPIQKIKMYHYQKGVFDVQWRYLNKYNINKDIANDLCQLNTFLC